MADADQLVEDEVERICEEIVTSACYDPAVVSRATSREFLVGVRDRCRDLIAALDEDDEAGRPDAHFE